MPTPLQSSGITGLQQVALHVLDLQRAVGFYRDVLGLRHIATFDPPGLGFFDLGGGTRLLLEKGAPPSLLYLSVPDAAAEVERLRAIGVQIESEPHVIFTDTEGQFGPAGMEETMAFFRDSEDNLVGLTSRRPAAGHAS